MFQVFTVLAAVADPITRQFTEKQFDELTAKLAAISSATYESAVLNGVIIGVCSTLAVVGAVALFCGLVYYQRRMQAAEAALKKQSDD